MDRVVHFEIPCDDVGRAQKFYTDVFGWRIMKAPMPGVEYFMVHTVETDERQMPKETGAINGGMTRRHVAGETPVIVVSVASLEESLRKAEEAGAKVVMPTQKVGDMGLYARIQDPEGNVVGVWQNVA